MLDLYQKQKLIIQLLFILLFSAHLLGLGSIFFVEWKMPTLIDLIIFIIMGLCGSIANLIIDSKL